MPAINKKVERNGWNAFWKDFLEEIKGRGEGKNKKHKREDTLKKQIKQITEDAISLF